MNLITAVRKIWHRQKDGKGTLSKRNLNRHYVNASMQNMTNSKISHQVLLCIENRDKLVTFVSYSSLPSHVERAYIIWVFCGLELQAVMIHSAVWMSPHRDHNGRLKWWIQLLMTNKRSHYGSIRGRKFQVSACWSLYREQRVSTETRAQVIASYKCKPDTQNNIT